jgi:ribosomal protein L31
MNTVLTQGIHTIFIDQLPMSYVSRKVNTVLVSKFLTMYHLVLIMNEKMKFKVALKICLNTHPFYYADEFLLSKNGS